MTAQEHCAEARDSAQTADRLFNENRPLQAAEIVWCSVKHAINAVAMRRGWRHSTFGQKKQVVERLEAEGYTDAMDLLRTARRLHIHSDNGILLDDAAISQSRGDIAGFTQRLLAMAES